MDDLSKKLLLKPTEAAMALGVSRSKLYDLIARRAIPSLRLDGSIRIPAIQRNAWIAEQAKANQ